MQKAFLFFCTIFITAWSYAQHDGHVHDITENKKIVDTVTYALSVTEEQFDFGKIPQGKPVHHNFEIQNTGNKSFKLTNVQASCGCTTPEWEKEKELVPGGKSSIKVGYNAAAEGAFSKVITVFYGDNQTKMITIKGEVWKTPAASAPANNNLNDF